MIELHTKMFCNCGRSFTAMIVYTIPLPNEIDQFVKCPFCGEKNHYKYVFELAKKCKPSWLDRLMQKIPFVKKSLHCVTDHFAYNDGTMDAEMYPRKCSCGQEILLRQERIM